MKRLAGGLVAGLMLCLALVAPTQAVGVENQLSEIPQVSSLSATARDSGIALAWDAIDVAYLPQPTSQSLGWQVIAKIVPGNFEVSFPVTQNDVLVSGLVNNREYSIQVYLSDGNHSGPLSTSVVATPAPEQVSGFIVEYEVGQKPVARDGSATGGSLDDGTVLDSGEALGARMRTVELPEAVSLAQARDIAQELAKDPAIKWAEPDTMRYPYVVTRNVKAAEASGLQSAAVDATPEKLALVKVRRSTENFQRASQSVRFGTVATAVPKLPTDRRVAFTVASGAMTATWSKFTGTGSISYTVTARSAGVATKTCTTIAVTCRFTNLSNGHIYQVLVTAKNSKGSTSLAVVNSPAVGIKASAPLNVSAVHFEVATARVNWSAPMSPGTGMIAKYVASAYLDSSGGSAIASCETSRSTSCFMTLPRTGVNYFYGVRAVTNVGTGPESATRVSSTLVPGFTSNDTYFVDSHNYQWYLKSDAASHGIRADKAWKYTTGDPSLVVGVIDTGITAHPDLDANVVAGYDFITNPGTAVDGDGRDSDPSDPGDTYFNSERNETEESSWHGTHVTGIIAAVGGNTRGVVGVAPTVKVQPLRALGKGGGATSDEIAAINWGAGVTVSGLPANPTPAKVLNLSMGGATGCGVAEQNAINAARARGVTVVVAAGNETQNALGYSPANCAGVVVVAASGPTGQLASYSNWGTPIDVLAPGGDGNSLQQSIVSTLNSGTSVPVAANYGGLEGTSMATPVVSGVVALMISINPRLTPDRVEAILKASVQTGTTCGTVHPCGAGLVDADKAVRLAAAG